MKIIKKIFLILLTIICIILLLLYDAYRIAPAKFIVRYETLSSKQIPKAMDDVTILFFSDLNYGKFMNQERLDKLIRRINDLSADVVVFGGNLFTDEITNISQEDVETVTKAMQKINAPLGKFTIFGDQDHLNEKRKIEAQTVYWNGNFEILENSYVQIHNKTSQGITLVGLDEPINSTTDISKAFENVPRNTYTILAVHTPDTANQIPQDLTNYVIAGHSLGGQIFYGIGASYIPEKATLFFHGKHKIGNHLILDITNGVGTKYEDIRFLANAEIVLYRLKHISENIEALQKINES